MKDTFIKFLFAIQYFCIKVLIVMSTVVILWLFISDFKAHLMTLYISEQTCLVGSKIKMRKRNLENVYIGVEFHFEFHRAIAVDS